MATSNTKSSTSAVTTPHSPQYYLSLKSQKGFAALTTSEQIAYALSVFFVNGAWKNWKEDAQKEFWKSLRERCIEADLEQDKEAEGREGDTRSSGEAIPSEEAAKQRERQIRAVEIRTLETQCRKFIVRRDQCGTATEEGVSVQQETSSDHGVTREDIDSERNRRKLLGYLRGRKMGNYESDPKWDDVVPIPQDDGEGALAQIAYTDEYSEGISSPPPPSCPRSPLSSTI